MNRRAGMQYIIKLGLPVALQSTLLASMGFIDAIMVSPLGEGAISAVGIGARWFAFISIFLFCFASAAQILIGQLHGSENKTSFSRMIGICIVHVSGVSVLIGSLFIIFPSYVAAVITDVEALIEVSKPYIQILGFIIWLTGFNIALDAIFRSVGKTVIPFKTYLVEMVAHIILNLVLIQGFLFIPALGIEGAALASLISKIIRTVVMLRLFHIHFKHYFSFEIITECFGVSEVMKKFYSIAWPILISSFTWSSTIFIGHAVIGHMGQQELVVMSILAPFEMVALAFVSGVCCGASIAISHAVGASNHQNIKVLTYSANFLAVIVGVIVGCTFAVFGFVLVKNLNMLEGASLDMFVSMLPIFILSVLLKTITGTQMQGILKSGGDTKFCMIVDIVVQWGILVPTILYFGLVQGASLFLIYFIIQLEEILKAIPCSYRINKMVWYKNLSAELK